MWKYQKREEIRAYLDRGAGLPFSIALGFVVAVLGLMLLFAACTSENDGVTNTSAPLTSITAPTPTPTPVPPAPTTTGPTTTVPTTITTVAEIETSPTTPGATTQPPRSTSSVAPRATLPETAMAPTTVRPFVAPTWQSAPTTTTPVAIGPTTATSTTATTTTTTQATTTTTVNDQGGPTTFEHYTCWLDFDNQASCGDCADVPATAIESGECP